LTASTFAAHQRLIVVPYGAYQQDAVAWFQAMRPEDIGALLLLDQLAGRALYRLRKDEILQLPSRDDLGDEFAVAGDGFAEIGQRARVAPVRPHGLCQPVGQHVVLLRPFLGDNCFNDFLERPLIAARARFYKIDQKITPRHR
jgi:hypothetical protein